MKLKEGVKKQYSDEMWYDLFSGGYIKPEELLDSEDDVQDVREAIETINEFLSTCVTEYDEVEE